MIVKTPGSHMGSPAAAEEGGEEVGGGRWESGERSEVQARSTLTSTAPKRCHMKKWWPKTTVPIVAGVSKILLFLASAASLEVASILFFFLLLFLWSNNPKWLQNTYIIILFLKRNNPKRSKILVYLCLNINRFVLLRVVRNPFLQFLTQIYHNHPFPLLVVVL